jgi:hypothetical protein
MIILGSSVAVGPVIILYSGYRFGWGTLEASIFVSAVSLTRTVILLIIFPAVNYFGRVRPAQRRRALGIVSHETNSGADSLDVWVIRVATAGEVLACVGYSLAQNGHAFFVSGMVTAMGGLGSASIQAAITKHVPSDKVGQVLGAIGMLHALSRVIGPLAFQGLYAATVKTLPQAFLMVLGGLFCVAFTGALLLKPHGECLNLSISRCDGFANPKPPSSSLGYAERRRRGDGTIDPQRRDSRCELATHPPYR